MATNLRLRPATEAALRAQAERTGRSQQELIRDALDRYLGVHEQPSAAVRNDLDELRAQGLLREAREPLRRVEHPLRLHGETSLDLLDREDRI